MTRFSCARSVSKSFRAGTLWLTVSVMGFSSAGVLAAEKTITLSTEIVGDNEQARVMNILAWQTQPPIIPEPSALKWSQHGVFDAITRREFRQLSETASPATAQPR
ncbi:MAG: hypothetical protein KDI36_15595 [Pseudomonadales bacterium]|nr:hypothetical protein [Pseudomonadales bacterium]